MIANFVTRTAIWIAALSLWASLHKPQDVAWIPTWAGMPTLVGGALIVSGVGLYVAGAVALARAKPEAPETPTHLIIDGPFRYVRNPVYLAMVIIVVGLSLLYQACAGLGHRENSHSLRLRAPCSRVPGGTSNTQALRRGL